jgi:hypothetical protein
MDPPPSDADIRTMIRIRFGDGLTEADVDALVPYVRATLETGRRLAAAELSSLDPRDISLASDPVVGT